MARFFSFALPVGPSMSLAFTVVRAFPPAAPVIPSAGESTLLFLGWLFDAACWQAGFHAKHLLGGMPLPRSTEFLTVHHHASGYRVPFPWLAFVGAPWLAPPVATGSQLVSFFHLATFLTVEAFIFLLFLFAIARPFVPYYGVMEEFHESGIEFVFRLAFWSAGCFIPAAATFGRIRRRRPSDLTTRFNERLAIGRFRVPALTSPSAVAEIEFVRPRRTPSFDPTNTKQP